VLRRDGIGFVITLSKRDFRYGNGILIEKDTFRFTEGDERGIVHHFLSKEELAEVFSNFEIDTLKEELIPIDNGNRAHFHLRFRKR
jgi:hypothetical protein